jgi:phosphoglycolate phosphatase-like HAD superfamily hydrolase
MRLLGYLGTLGVAMSLVVKPSGASSKTASSTSTLIVLDIDNTLYQEQEAGIEAQIVEHTHTYCRDVLGLDKEQADDLYRAYGSTIEGLKQTLWKNYADEQLQNELHRFYQQVYTNIDMSKLLLEQGPASESESTSSSTGYSHAKDRKLVCRLLKACPYPICVASNSPSWHIEKVLQTMGLAGLPFQARYTPDRLPFFPTKHSPEEFFFAAKGDDDDNAPSDILLLSSYDRILVLDDSQHNLDQINESFPNAEKIHITSDYSLATALLHSLGLVDPSFQFDQVQYLQSKNTVDRNSIHPTTWNQVIGHLRDLQDVDCIQIVDVGAGLLSMLDLFLHGDATQGLNALFGYPKENISLQYTAYEANRELLIACQARLLEWGFERKEKVSEEEFLYEYQNIQVRLRPRDFDSSSSDEPEKSAPHLLVGCCFADLMDPDQLVPSLIRSFNLLESQETLLYFPITFCGTTQFLPPQPFQGGDDSSTIPSDTVAFGLYSKALTETLGHNLDPFLLQKVMEEHGASLQTKGASNWEIDPKKNPYLFDTMLYFFGTAGGPHILEAGWDAPGWLLRAKKNRPTIQVSNIDLLFRIGKKKAEDPACRDEVSANKSLHEISFTAPETVSTTEKEIPELGPNEVLSKWLCPVYNIIYIHIILLWPSNESI